MRRRELLIKQKVAISAASPISIQNSVAGDVVSYDSTNHCYLIQKANSVVGTPIGIVIIPGSHNVYSDNSTLIMSLNPMNCTTPTTGGSSEQAIYWGVYETAVSGLPLYNHVVMCNNGGTPISTASGYSTYSNLPGDVSSWTGSTCPTDSVTKYKTASDTSVSPSPYNGSARNPVYYQTSSPSVSTNCLSDFNGRLNTDLLLKQRGAKDYNTWKPGVTTEADFSAASCCDMYYTKGTEQGDWYLPSAGEFGYAVARMTAINSSLSTLGYPQLSTSTYYWTSTGYDTLFSRLIYFSNGAITYGDKNTGYYVRACTRIYDK